MTTTMHPLVRDHLRRLNRAARVLPGRQGEELVAEIRAHLDTALPAEATEADVRNVLDDLGSPDAIVAAAQPDQPRASRGTREVVALLLLTGLPVVVGWVIGAVLLVSSPLWSRRQKFLGLLVWPGGMLAGVFIALQVPVALDNYAGWRSPMDLPLAPMMLLAVVAQVVVLLYLYVAAGRQARISLTTGPDHGPARL